jgi:nucleotidyltransferase substrate binding protein (TIGR01987 family)
MDNNDIRWEQRFNNYKKALQKLSEAIDAFEDGEFSDLEKEGLIQRFEYTHELAWLTIKDFYENQGETNIQGSKDAIKLAFNRGLISNGKIWIEMIESRQLTVHTYNEDTAEKVVSKIVYEYSDLFVELKEKLEEEIYGKQSTLLIE